jgi:ABC-type polysaccharide/polyol phosphate export permease
MPESLKIEDLRSLSEGWRVQRRVVGALLLREVLTRYGRKNVGFLWLFLEPMLFTLAITALWTATRSVHGSDIPIVAFALTGYSSVLLWRNMPGRCINALRPNATLLFHRQVKILDVYLARVVLEAVAATMSFVALGLIFWSIDWLAPPEDAMQVLWGWLLLAWFGASFGILLGGLSESVDMVEKFWPPFSYLMFPLSGAAFIVDALPTNVKEIVLYIPVLHAVEYIRDGYFGSHFRAHFDLSYLILCNTALTLFAVSQVRRIGTPIGEE